ncbi:23104_t:CDS:2, partial [Racocetra persica]
GSGKTTLANVLSKSDEFKEDDSSLTKRNTKLSKEQLLEKFEEELGTYIDEGMSQYLFDNKALDFTAIVRTNFTDFRSKKRCEEDTKELTTFFNDKEIYEEINNKVLKKEKIIYVNNPLISFNDHSNHEKEIKANKNLRQKSRDKILEKEKVALNIGGKKLKGRLSVKGFSNLKGLNCSNNQFTSLDLSSCKDLIELRCNNNNFTNLNFLKQVANLEILEIKNNPNIPLQNLKILSKLTKLKELHITNIEFKNFDYLPANSVTGGILAATVNPILGGVLAAVSPVVEINNFNELLGTLKRIAGGELGEVNKKLDELNNKVKEFLQDYDKDGNREIDLD